MRTLAVIVLILLGCNVYAQTLGGAATYNFLKLPASTTLSAAGGVNVSMASTDAGFATNNPALLNTTYHSALAASFNAFFKGSKAYTITGVQYLPKLNTTFSGQVFFIDYGSIQVTDASGNEAGFFRTSEFYMQASASRSYGARWQYGATLKYASSNYGTYKSSAILADMGLLYHDSGNLVRVGLLAKNMGVQLKAFNSNEDLPFDLQIGVSKRLANAPFGFSISAQQVQRFNTIYNDTLFNTEPGAQNKLSFGNKLFNHFVGAVHIYAGNNLEVTAAYNRLRRNELNIGNSGNGLNGFSGGFTAHFKKIGVSYARSYYGRSFAYNQLGIQLKLSALNIGNEL